MIRLSSKVSATALLLGCLCLAAPISCCADDAKVPKLTTVEQQVDYLTGALSEGLRSMDWKMICLATDGFKGLGLSGKDLEIAVLRAERDAALQPGMMMGGNAQIPVLGQSARARAGDTQAVETLRGWAANDIPVVKAPDNSLFQKAPAEFQAAQKAFQDYTQALTRKEYAVLGLALLNEPGIAAKAIAALRVSEANNGGGMMMMNGFRTDPLVLATLYPDVKAGFKSLLDLCAEAAVSNEVQTSVVEALIRMTPGKKQFQAPDAAFTLQGDISAQFPQDALAQLAKPYIALVKHWAPDPKKQFDNSLNTLMNAGGSFEAHTFDADGIAAIVALREKLTGPNSQWMQQSINQLLKQQGAEAAIAPRQGDKPPAPPKDF